MRGTAGKHLRTSGVNNIADEQIVDQHADDSADQRSDDRHPQVRGERPGEIPWHGKIPLSTNPGQKPRAEITGWIDRISRIGAEGDTDRRHGEADDQRPHIR